MSVLNITHFDDYFGELHGKKPYSWQRRLAERAIAGNWPGAITLPTGVGKTACIDIAVFSLACQASQPTLERTAPARLFFCVNRRVIVDEACRRSREIAEKIWRAERGQTRDNRVLRDVATALRKLARTSSGSDTPPLDVLELRGGIFRDNRWARSATQPTIVCTTIDQLGSRLLFRGYGVSPNAAPIQAALIAYDSLILLDESHISKAFLQTLVNVRQYLDPEKWAERSAGVRPVVVVPMTATPPDGVAQDEVIQLGDADRENKSLHNRLTAGKPARLSSVTNIVLTVLAEAKRLAKGEPKAVGVIVNRVATARALYDALRDQHRDASVELVIGSMRPIDRDRQSERLRELVGPAAQSVASATSFVVATQCLEVGADYDFDVLITECASLDALRQRFGRLNRAGRPIGAEAVILTENRSIKPDDKLNDEKPEDPIYGNSLARTWNWLSEHSTDGIVNFGVDIFDSLLTRHGEGNRIPEELLAPSARINAPVMLPAYIDFWCQTSPRPEPDPDVSLFLHGQEGCGADVQVCWRSDLVDDGTTNPREDWCDVVALLPPTSAECMTVPLSRVRQWLVQGKPDSSEGDLLGVPAVQDEDEGTKDWDCRGQMPLRHGGVVWRGGNRSVFLDSPRKLLPGDTLVLPEGAGGWNQLGHVPCVEDGSRKGVNTGQENADPSAVQGKGIDVAESAFQAARDRIALRIHPAFRSRSPVDELLKLAAEGEAATTLARWQDILTVTHNAMPDDARDASTILSRLLESGFTFEPYPDGQGVVLTTRRRLGSTRDWFLPSVDEGDDSTSRIGRREPISLAVHTQHVVDSLNNLTASLSDLAVVLRQAATLHDHGKVDDRFQAMLRRDGRTDAWLRISHATSVLAKSDGVPQTPKERRDACRRAELPDGFRHEMLSVQLAQKAATLSDDLLLRDLVLHLIAAHHGFARPFAPVVIDKDPPDVEVDGMSLRANERLDCPAHRIDSGVADRFWSLNRHFGWWGLAYLESLLRLADQQASAAEDSGALDDKVNKGSSEPTV